MAIPQGTIEFPGVKNFLHGSFTLSHGTGPSSAVIHISPQPGFVPRIGPLTIRYGSFRLDFPDCICRKVGINYDSNGHEVWTLHLLDWRWRWRQEGRISGYYNTRRGGQESAGRTVVHRKILPGTAKSARDLTELCLDAMQQHRRDVSQVPKAAYPEIEWDCALPADALSHLCESLGFRVVPAPGNLISIVPERSGGKLPVDGTSLYGGTEIEAPWHPDTIVVVSDRIRWQTDLQLEAVGLDTDQKWKPIYELSYTPDEGWDKSDPRRFSEVAAQKSEKERLLAIQTVFRCYRILDSFDISAKQKKIVRDRILPIEATQLTHWYDETGVWRPMPALVYGEWYHGKESHKNIAAISERDVNNMPATTYPGSFSLIQDQGIVKFGEPVYRYGTGDQAATRIEARLWLRTAFSLRDEETRGWIRMRFPRDMRSKKTGGQPAYVVHNDIEPGYWIVDQKESADLDCEREQAKYYLDAFEATFLEKEPATMAYAGFRWIPLDGTIQQITWSVDGEGYARTTASRNCEHSPITVPYRELQMQQSLDKALRAAKETERTKEKDRLKNRG